jgi:hypothetical protein
MTAVNNDDSNISYGELSANFGAMYTATQELVKMQGSKIASMQAQLQAMKQYCMALQQQPPPAIHTPQQQQHGHCGSSCCTFQGSSCGYKAPAYLQPPAAGQHPMQPPPPFKCFENWNYCHTHGVDINNHHTSRTCQKPGPSPNPSVARLNTMGGATAGLHKMILPSASGRAPPPSCQQQAPAPAIWQQPPPLLIYIPTMVAMRPMMPMMPMMPYQAINHMGQQFNPPTSADALSAPARAPPAGMMMHYYAPYQQPPPF